MKNKLKPDEQALFRRAMRGVKPLAQTKVKISPELPPLKPKRVIFSEDQPVVDPFSDHEYLDLASSEDVLEFARSGISLKMMRSLRRGQETVEAVLDLHGKTVEEARLSLYRFLLACQAEGKTRVLLIHGKGRGKAKPILKNKLNHWLRQSEYVLAFCSAKPQDGGTGALYLRLKKG